MARSQGQLFGIETSGIRTTSPMQETGERLYFGRELWSHNSETRNEKALEHFCSRVLGLVRLAGIEPTTPWFVAKYSIQLSYSRLRPILCHGN
jgi:hypothetical protein